VRDAKKFVKLYPHPRVTRCGVYERAIIPVHIAVCSTGSRIRSLQDSGAKCLSFAKLLIGSYQVRGLQWCFFVKTSEHIFESFQQNLSHFRTTDAISEIFYWHLQRSQRSLACFQSAETLTFWSAVELLLWVSNSTRFDSCASYLSLMCWSASAQVACLRISLIFERSFVRSPGALIWKYTWENLKTWSPPYGSANSWLVSTG